MPSPSNFERMKGESVMAEKKKRFEYKLTLGKHPVSGETIRRSFYSTKSLRDAKRKAETFQRNYEMEMMAEGTSIIREEKFSSWAFSCLETYKRPYVKFTQGQYDIAYAAAKEYGGLSLKPRIPALHASPSFGASGYSGAVAPRTAAYPRHALDRTGHRPLHGGTPAGTQ